MNRLKAEEIPLAVANVIFNIISRTSYSRVCIHSNPVCV